jgi:Putative peptidoglycan binding domain
MRILLVLTCCFGLASFAGAAQQDDQDHNQGKKKGGGNAPAQQQAVTPQTGKVYKAGPGGGPHGQNFQQQSTVHYKGTGKNAKNWQGPVTGGTQKNVSGSASGNAATTKFGKKYSGQANATGGAGAQKFQKQHFNLQTNKVVNKYKTVNFNQNYKISGAQNWKGSKYVVFQNYHPQWHDQWWWSSHHNHIVFVFGAPYFWDTGYWYPAWGYDPGANYYYDGPIYASSPDYDPGQVVANVQSALQQQGYYQGEIDGVLGPQTRAALAEYQSAQGLEPTGAVDEPTLETLGMV